MGWGNGERRRGCMRVADTESAGIFLHLKQERSASGCLIALCAAEGPKISGKHPSALFRE